MVQFDITDSDSKQVLEKMFYRAALISVFFTEYLRLLDSLI